MTMMTLNGGLPLHVVTVAAPYTPSLPSAQPRNPPGSWASTSTTAAAGFDVSGFLIRGALVPLCMLTRSQSVAPAAVNQLLIVAMLALLQLMPSMRTNATYGS